MTEAISESEYEETIEEMTDTVVTDSRGGVDEGIFDSFVDGVYTLSSEEIEFHEWFAKEHGASLYGSIIEHSDGDPEQHTDVYHQLEGKEPAEVVERLASLTMEADLIERVRKRRAESEA